MENIINNIVQLGRICDSLSGLSEGERVRRTKSGTFEAPGRWAQTKGSRASGKPNFFYRFVQWLSLLTRGYTAKKCDRMFTAFQKECSAPLASLYLLVDTNREHFTEAEKQKIEESLTALKTKIGAARNGIDTLGATYAKKNNRYQIVLKALGVLNATLAEQEALTDTIKGRLRAAPGPVLPNIPPLPLPPPVIPLNRHEPQQQAERHPIPAPQEAEIVSAPAVTANGAAPPPPPPPGACAVKRYLLQQFPSEPATPSANARDLVRYKSLPRDTIEGQLQELKTSIDFCEPLIAKYAERFKKHEALSIQLNEIVKAKNEKSVLLEKNSANLEKLLAHQMAHTSTHIPVEQKTGTIHVMFYPDDMADAINQRIEVLKLDPAIDKRGLNRIEDNQKFSLAIPELKKNIDEEIVPAITAYGDQEVAIRKELRDIESEETCHGMNFTAFKEYISKKQLELNTWKRVYNSKNDFVQNGERKGKGKAPATPPAQNTLEKRLENDPELLQALRAQEGISPILRATVLRKGGSMNALFDKAQSPQR